MQLARQVTANRKAPFAHDPAERFALAALDLVEDGVDVALVKAWQFCPLNVPDFRDSRHTKRSDPLRITACANLERCGWVASSYRSYGTHGTYTAYVLTAPNAPQSESAIRNRLLVGTKTASRTKPMCGIAGLIDPSSSEADVRAHLRRMLDLIVHRGPDGSGMHVEEGLAIGMRRLSIIDIAGGQQPIWNEDKTVGVVFNGEIYNYVELRRELIASGHEFHTQTDTEVLVHLYEQHGDAMLGRLRGMFAFALLDTRQNRVLLARDRFGQKPLYYAQEGARLAFASELKCLLTLPWVNRERDAEAFLDYISWFSLPAPRTHFRGIRKLTAGGFMTFKVRGLTNPDVRKFWSYELDEPPDLTALEPAVEALDDALRESVKLHLRADVPVGVLLSSGLDSRTVAAYAQELQEGKMQTFTVGFGGPDSETQGAAETAREIRSQHHTLELTSDDDFLQSLDRIAWHLDEPVGDPAAFAVLKVCELARGHVKVLLSGEGSDEVFAGVRRPLSRHGWRRSNGISIN